MTQVELNALWEKLCKELGDRVSTENIEVWRENFSLLEAENEEFTVGYLDSGKYVEFTSEFMSEIYDAGYAACGKLASFHFKRVNDEVPTEENQTESYRRDAARDDYEEMVRKNRSQKKNTESQRKISHRYKAKNNTLKRTILSMILAILFVGIAIATLVVGINYVENLNFSEKFYTISSKKVRENFRVIHISDLHNAEYGTDNKTLLHRVDILHPDIIVMTGDCIEDDDDSLDNVLTLCRELAEIAPVYYIYGNNENAYSFGNDMTLESLDSAFGFNDENRDPELLYQADNGLRAQIESTGVKVLMNEVDTITIGENTIDVYGVLNSNASAFWPYAGSTFSGDFLYSENSQHFKLLLCHEPFIFEELIGESWGDLALCGHTHGGLIDLPILGGLYVPGAGFLPELNGHYVAGKYSVNGTPLIVSTGLSNRGAVRIGNSPELVIVDVTIY